VETIEEMARRVKERCSWRYGSGGAIYRMVLAEDLDAILKELERRGQRCCICGHHAIWCISLVAAALYGDYNMLSETHRELLALRSQILAHWQEAQDAGD
jgi:hypothetical protein